MNPHPPPAQRRRTVLFWLWHAGLPVLLVIFGTLFFRTTSFDLSLAAHFYSAQGPSWPVGREAPWQQLYDFGEFPGWLIFGAALGVVVAAGWVPVLRRWRRSAVFLVLVMVIGPGLLTNAVLKDHWGRPRPRQIQEFGGSERFEPVWVFDASSRGKSFPSGHASVAFYLMALYFVAGFHRWSPGVRGMVFGIGLAFGILMGVARMAQGGHFASDVLWAFAVVWLTACVCAAWILRVPESLKTEGA